MGNVQLDGTIFHFDFEFPPGRNPRGTFDRFREELRGWFVTGGLHYGMGALGGGLHCYGEVGPLPPSGEAERQALAAWVCEQRVCILARLSAVEPFDSDADRPRPITDWVFEVDNLTAADRAQADSEQAELLRRIEALRRK